MDPQKYVFRSMSQKLMEASEGKLANFVKVLLTSSVLDDRIEMFAKDLVEQLSITDDELANPAVITQV